MNLQPEWWKHPLPEYIGSHPTNYVLNEVETAAIATAFAALSVALNKEGDHVAGALRAIRTQRVPAMQAHPTPVTVNDILKFMVALGQTSAALTELLTAMSKKRGEATEAQLRG